MTQWLLLALSLVLTVLCGVFVAAEFSFVTVDRATVERAAASGDARAAGTLSALRTLSTQLSGAQLGITITNLAIGYLAEPAIGTLLHDPLAALGVRESSTTATAYVIALLISTTATMLIGELIPKNIALSVPLATANAVQMAQRGFTKAMAWPIRILNGSANAILAGLGVEAQEELRSARSPYELRSLVLRSADQGALEGTTARLVARSISFGDRTAADVRTPRVRVRFLDRRQSASEVIDAARETGHSRFPVTGRGLDDIVGVVHVKQAVAIPADRRRSVRLDDLASPASVVPDSIELDPLLSILRGEGLQIAIVVDEYGGTDGVVTLEDLVEEIVGDIADEHDRRSPLSSHRRDGTWVLSGMLRPDEVQDETGIELPQDDDYETIAGLVTQRLGRLATAGDEVVLDLPGLADDGRPTATKIRLTVDRMDGRRIDRLSMSAQTRDSADPQDGAR